MSYTHSNALGKYGVTPLIVATDPSNGSHVTLASALAVAGAGETVFLRDSVIEDVTLPANVNIASWQGASASTPSITGKITLTVASTNTISGIRLVTNGDNFLAVTGSAASVVNLNNCYLDCADASGITFSSSSSLSQINIFNCRGNLGTTGIKLFDHTGIGYLLFNLCDFSNSGGSTTSSTCSSGVFDAFRTSFYSPFTLSSTSGSAFEYCEFITTAQNVTAVTFNGVTHSSKWCRFSSGTASAISCGGTTNDFLSCAVASSNTNAITGSGSIGYQGLLFTSTSSTVNTTTQTGSGTLKGSRNTAPSIGFLGERISSAVQNIAAGSTGSVKTITSISLTAGVWDVTALSSATSGSINLSLVQVGISTTTNTIEGNSGDQYQLFAGPASHSFISESVPAFRVILTTTTTYYLVTRVDYASGSPTVNGRISGVRVG